MNVVSVRVRVLSSLMSTRSSHWDLCRLNWRIDRWDARSVIFTGSRKLEWFADRLRGSWWRTRTCKSRYLAAG